MLDKLLGTDKKESPFSSIISTLGSGLTAGATSAFTNNLFGTTAADEAVDVAQSLYPGITPHERLAAGGGGAAQAGASESLSNKALNAQINQSKRMFNSQQKRMSTDANIADETNKTSLATAMIMAGSMGGLGFHANPFTAGGAGAAGLMRWIGQKFKAGEAPKKPDNTPQGVSNPYKPKPRAYTPEQAAEHAREFAKEYKGWPSLFEWQ